MNLGFLQLFFAYMVVTAAALPVDPPDLPTPSVPAADLDWNSFDLLVDDVKQRILEDLFKDDPQNIRNLMVASRRAREVLAAFDFTEYSVIGSANAVHADVSLCGLMNQNPKLLQSIRHLHVTWTVYVGCSFSASNLLKLQSLTLQLNDAAVLTTDLKMVGLLESSNTEEIFSLTLHDMWSRLDRHYPAAVKIHVVDAEYRNQLHDVLGRLNVADRMQMVNRLLITGRVDVNAEDTDGNTPIHFCFLADLHSMPQNSVLNTTECLETLLSYGANPNQMNRHGHSSVHISCLLNVVEPLSILHQHNGDINLKSVIQQDGELVESSTPIDMAIRGAMDSVVPTNQANLLYRSSVAFNYKNLYTTTAADLLAWSELYLNHEEVRLTPAFYLLENGANLHTTVNGFTPLEFALHQRIWPIVYAILNKPVEEIPLTARDPRGCSILLNAVQAHVPFVVEKLLSFGVLDVNDMNGNCSPALIEAVTDAGDEQIFLSLLHAGADPLIRTADGWTPMTAAVVSSTFHPVIVTELLQRGSLMTDRIVGASPEYEASALAYLLLRTLNQMDADPFDHSSTLLLNQILDNLPMTESSNGISDVDYHLLMFAVLRSGDPDLFYKHQDRLPGRVLFNVQGPYFEEEHGFILSDDGKAYFAQAFRSLRITDGDYYAKRALAERNPEIYKFVESIDLFWSPWYRKALPTAEHITEVTLYFRGQTHAVDEETILQDLRKLYPMAHAQVNLE